MKSAATGKAEYRLYNAAAGLFDALQCILKMCAIEYNQGAACAGLRAQLGAIKAAIKTSALNGCIVRAVIDKCPAECRAEEPLGALKVTRWPFHVVYFFRHSLPLNAIGP